MKKKIIYCGIDVDDKNFNVGIKDTESSEILEIKTFPSVVALKKKMNKNKFLEHDLRFCYEASYSGFLLHRQLKKAGLFCEVIAPSLIPEVPGHKVKTDRLDCRKLAEFYANGLLTPVVIPCEEDEAVRDVIRTRGLILEQQNGLRKHLLALCRRVGLDYRKSINKKTASYWTQMHCNWLLKEIKTIKNDNVKFNLTTTLETCEQLGRQVLLYDQQILKFSESIRYQKQVKILKCFRGIDTLSSMILVTELGDINRFPHPEKVSSYAGLDIMEYSSGGKERRFGITKQGNEHIRKTVVESCQFAFKPPRVSRQLKDRRIGVDPELIAVADRCMHRLHKKATRLLYKGKPKNKVKVACAREMLCFIWEALKTVA
jgi:transposase